jgi:hypothetical protein
MYIRGCTLDKTVIILCSYGQAFGESIGCRQCPARCFVSLPQTKTQKPEIAAPQAVCDVVKAAPPRINTHEVNCTIDLNFGSVVLKFGYVIKRCHFYR